ncbi:helix-turn-helix domain-containing protein [Nostoc sp.]|uniref:helix-turn-helix domain-containing protein n=1 Tax=Nostoc sp. TaxID=1180 RepID=UPI002FF8AB58
MMEECLKPLCDDEKMPALNTIKQFISKREISRYRFWQEIGLGRDTAYRLCNDQTYIPTGNVLEKICATYKVQPGELLNWIPDD